MIRISLLAATLALAGCATITRGTSGELVVTSTPPGAQVTLSTGAVCAATPCGFNLPRREKVAVTVEKPGCTAQVIEVGHKVAGKGGAALAGNALAGGLIGMGLDAGTGASLDFDPNPVAVTLVCGAV